MRTTRRRSLLGLELLEDRAVPATFTVTNALDAGLGSLRQAILDANATAGGDSITFDPGAFSAPETITLTSGQLVVSDSVTITGPGADLLSVNGNSASRVFLIDDGDASINQDVRIEGITISGGRVEGAGAGVSNRENLVLVAATVSGNAATGFSSQGGGIVNDGVLTMSGVVVSGNQASYFGGGIENNRTLALSNVTITGNRAAFGAGLANTRNGTAVASATVVTDNESFNRGGGIENRGALALTGATVSGNRSLNSHGGGVANVGALTVTGGTISGNSAGTYGGNGGGISNQDYGSVTVTAATISGNTAGYSGNGGGIYNAAGGPMILTDVTVTGNSAGSDGGGIFNRSDLILTRVTVSGNQSSGGGGVTNFGSFATLAFTGGFVTDNAAAAGGGIANSGATLTLAGVEITRNTGTQFAGGLLNIEGTAELTDSTVAENVAGTGGGAGIFNSTFSTVSLVRSTVSGNTTSGSGGGFFNSGTLTLTNATVSGNTSLVSGGGFFFDPSANNTQATLAQVTVAGNAAPTGGGIANSDRSVLELVNTIVADSSQGEDLSNVRPGGVILSGTNLVEDGSITGANVLNVDPLLGPLTNNGGPTKTHAFLAASPAVDAGDNVAVPAGVATDQRGFSRIARGVVDLGAFEVQNQAPTVTDFSISGSEDTPVAISRADFEAAFIDPDSTLNRVRIVDVPANGTLTLNGVAIAAGAVIPAAQLDNLVFQPAPNYFGTATFHYTAADEYGFAANSGTVTLVITPVNDAPTVSAPGPQTAYEDVDLAVPPITVGDVDSSALTITLSVISGTMFVGTTTGVTVVGNGTGAVTLIGAPSALNAALASLTYRGARNFAGVDTLSVAASDGSLTTTVNVAIRVKSATEQATDLIARVNALEAGGALNHGQATALRASLNLKGNSGDIGKVTNFLVKVQAFKAVGILSPAEADVLLDFGRILLISVSRR